MKIKNILLGFFLHIISLVLCIIFISSITNTKNSDFSSLDNSNEETLNVSSFITDTNESKNEKLEDFLEDLYEERNDSIENSNVEKLYKYYDTSINSGSNSLEQEFKRIAYFRDWSVNKNARLYDIDSDIIITSIKEKDGIFNVIFNEDFSFNFSFNKSPKNKHKFSHTLVHTLQVKPLDNNNFIVLSDYYDDFLKSELDLYKFDLTEKTLVPTKKSDRNLNLLIE